MPIDDLHLLEKEFFTPNEVAEYFSVTADAVRKWLRSGRLQTEMTPGGHHRIPRSSFLEFIKSKREKRDLRELPPWQKPFQYCWEFHAGSHKMAEGCRQCIVYRSRTGKCFELAKIQTEVGHAKIFCTNTCEECDYYEMIQGMTPKLLIVSNRPELHKKLKNEINNSDIALRFSTTPYSCSKVVDSFCPDYIIVDCSLDRVCCRDFIKDLGQDSRIPMTRIILAGKPEQFPKECDQMVFAYLVTPFAMKDVIELVNGL